MNFYEIELQKSIDKMSANMQLPVSNLTGGGELFDPWSMFPVYGVYSKDFDDCAIDVLNELQTGKKIRRDLGAEMFREMLCNLSLCNYGSSPRFCFPEPPFKELLPELIKKWSEYSRKEWK